MKTKALRERTLRGCAWLLMALSLVVVITGYIIGPTQTGHAQQLDPPAVGAAAGEEIPNLATGVGDDGHPVPPEVGVAVERARAVARAGGRGDDREFILAVVGAARASDTLAPVVVVRAESIAAEASKPKFKPVGEGEASGFLDRAISLLGVLAMIGLALLLSNNRRKVDWKLVGVGVALQLLFAVLIFKVEAAEAVFAFATEVVEKLLKFTDAGSSFIFASFATGQWEPALRNFAFGVLPTIIFFSALMTILYHLGVMQAVVRAVAWVMQKTMKTSGAETLSAAANIFVGQTEAPLVIKPYVDRMTVSELMTVMTGGFATVAGGVLAIYVSMLRPIFPDIAGHLLAASVMSAPAALVIGKIIYPETQTPETAGEMVFHDEKIDVNVLDAASRGAAEGLKLALNVGAMLLAFLALIELVNYLISLPSLLWNEGVLAELNAWYRQAGLVIPAGCDVAAAGGVADKAVMTCVETMQAAAGVPEMTVLPMITLQKICGVLFWPLAWVMGVPAVDCYAIGQLLGTKIVVNELVAYSQLAEMLSSGQALQDRSVIIATYALCGFANFGSIGIQLGGIGGIAPERKHDLAKIAFKAMLGGTLAAFMTGTVAGILV